MKNQFVKSFLILAGIGLLSACTGQDNAGNDNAATDVGVEDGISPGTANDDSVQGADTGDRVPASEETTANERQADGKVADSQSNSEADYALTQKIRQEITKDESLSTNAHNIKIITENGKVTLKGLVNSAAEKTKVEQYAKSAAGSAPVENQLEITQ